MYLQSTPNPRVCYAMLRRIVAVLMLPIDLDEMSRAADEFDRQVNEAVAKNPELQEYVRQLEDALESAQSESEEEMPSADVLVKDLEDYLRRKREDHKGDTDQPSKD